MQDYVKLSECEEMIMQLLWDEKEDPDLVQVAELAKRRFGKVWKLQTIATFMTRLATKGYINIYRVGRYSHYQSVKERQTYLKKRFMEMANIFSDGDIGALRIELNQMDLK